MTPGMTPAVSRAIEAAARFVGEAASVEPLHLLHGLLDEEEGAAVTLAVRAGFDYAGYLARRGPGQPPRLVPLSPASEALLFTARELSYELSHEGIISSEALLLALTRAMSLPGLESARLEELLQEAKPPVIPLEDPPQLADLTEQIDLARILDASFNRAREALRVLEDYARFALDDAFLCGELKNLRHQLTAAMELLGPSGRHEARETQRDVGIEITGEREFDRASLAEVVAANAKRLQEALRSMEEFAKVQLPLLAERVEQMRYASYTLERALRIGTVSRQRLRDARLYVLLSASSCVSSLQWTIEEAAAGGADIVQLREKNLSDRELLARARQVRQWTRQAGVLFIVNDRPDVARLVEADGVHLGQDDLSVKEARRIVGPTALIGVSTHSLEQLRQAILDGANYVGLGPVFPSVTKNFTDLAGLEYVRSALAETTIPAFAIGGIHAGNLAQVVAVGTRRIAVSSAITAADDPRLAAAQLRAGLS